ncbi:TasA family protein [Romboutsia sp.]|uniref:TasA family protein n=1 Tax=Romboutsia sp. TaxID=1965302 RepID=UPI003F2BD6A1
MSRLRRLKERKRKQFIKTVMTSLVLTLSIGCGSTMTTYAWFTDKETVENDLVITMGELDVNITEGFNISELNRNDEAYKTFSISNDGTLKQHISMKLDGINKDIEKYINYKIVFNNEAIQPINGEELLNGDHINLKYDNGTLVVLNPTETLTATAYITISKDMPKDLINSFVENALTFDLKVIATQVNNENIILDWGFSDIAIQKNSLQFEQITTPELPQEKNIDVQLVADEETVKIFINGIKEINNKDISKIEVIGGTGEFKENIEIKHDNDNIVFIQKNPAGNFNITNTEFDDSNTLNLKFSMNDGTYKEIKFRFRIKYKNANNYELEGYYEVISSGKVDISSEPEIVEPPKEEVEIPNKPEIVEPPKEEEPNKPETVEPPKEEEPSEPEIVEPPSEPEIVEPPKDEEAIISNKPETEDIETINIDTQV